MCTELLWSMHSIVPVVNGAFLHVNYNMPTDEKEKKFYENGTRFIEFISYM